MHRLIPSIKVRIAVILGMLGVLLLGALVLFERTFQPVDTQRALFRLMEKQYQIQQSLTTVFYGDNIQQRLYEERKLLSRDLYEFQTLLDEFVLRGEDLRLSDHDTVRSKLLNLQVEWHGMHARLVALIAANSELQKMGVELLMQVNGKWVENIIAIERAAWASEKIQGITTLKKEGKALRNMLYRLNVSSHQEGIREIGLQIQEQLQEIHRQFSELKGLEMEASTSGMIVSCQEEFDKLYTPLRAIIEEKAQFQEGLDTLWRMLPAFLQRQKELFKILEDRIQNDEQGFRTTSIVFAISVILMLIGLYLFVRHVFSRPLERVTGILSRLSTEDTKSYLSTAREVRCLPSIDQSGEVGMLTRAVYEVLLRVGEKTSELQEMNRKAIVSSEAKTHFLASISHELKTPLNAIIGYSELLIDETQNMSVDIREDAERIHKSGWQLYRAVESLLDLSKIENNAVRLEVSTFNLCSLIGDVAEDVSSLIRERENILEVKLPKTEAMLHTDMSKMQQILMNLLGAAARYTERGLLTLAMSYPQNETEGRVVISIKGVGKGMSQNQLKAVLRLDRGANLGLVICREFLNLMGGEISLEYGDGTTIEFLVTLPVSIEESPTQKENLTL